MVAPQAARPIPLIRTEASVGLAVGARLRAGRCRGGDLTGARRTGPQGSGPTPSEMLP